VGQQFFEGQTMLGPVMAEGEFVDVGIGGRVVQVADRVGSPTAHREAETAKAHRG